MLEDADLDAAIAEGLVTQESADALRTFAARRRGGLAPVEAQDDEHFRFLRGFNDLFFAIGVLFLGFGVAYFAGKQVTGNLLGAVLFWALAELLIRRMRLVLPGIILACFFVVFFYQLVPINLSLFPAPPASTVVPLSPIADYFRFGSAAALATKSLVAFAAAVVFYLRFLLPFTLLLVAGSLVIAVASIAGIDPNDGLVHFDKPFYFYPSIFLVCGLAIFAAAMLFDLADRARRTRRADCAFWLHLLAAPLIVNSLIGLARPDLAHLTGAAAAMMLSIIALLTLVAIVVDRRALLVSALTYVGVIVATAIRSAATTDQTTVFFLTLVILGSFVLTLGVGWFPLRRLILARIPSHFVNRLPPVVPA